MAKRRGNNIVAKMNLFEDRLVDAIDYTRLNAKKIPGHLKDFRRAGVMEVNNNTSTLPTYTKDGARVWCY